MLPVFPAAAAAEITLRRNPSTLLRFLFPMVSLADSRRSARRSPIPGLALLLGGFLIIGLPAALPWSTPLRSAVVSAAMPLMHAGASVRDGVGSAFAGLADGGRAVEENEALRAEMTALRAQLASMEAQLAAREATDALHEAIPGHAPRTIAARVIAPVIDGSRRRLWIAIPDGTHVHPGQVVLGPGGVIGTVREVHTRDALVQLLADGESRWGAEIPEREKAGVLHGTGHSGTAEFRPEQTAAGLQPGDIVLTSGRRGSTAPAGLPLGTVREISTDIRGEKRAVLDLAEPGESLRTVFLLEARQIPWKPPG